MFTPNQGQWEKEVEYRYRLPSGQWFLEKEGWTYMLYDSHKLHQLKHQGPDSVGGTSSISAHSVRVRFLGAKTPKISHTDPTDHYSNFFIGKDKEQWASKVHSYRKVRYEEVYQGIDALFKKSDEKLKYEFHVSPNKNPENIQLAYKGADELSIEENGDLKIGTSVQPILEQRPYAYQIIDGNHVEVPCEFHLSESGVLGFQFPDGYEKGAKLIIDPQVVFGTYTGSTSDNWGNTATYDDEGHLYAGGTGFGNGYPTTTGAYQISFAGATCDITISKFSPDGSNLIYSTYLGGSKNEVPSSMVVDNQGQLYVLGITGSSDFPTTSNAFQTNFMGGASTSVFNSFISFNNGSDITITKFSQDGSSLIGSSYLGGSSNDGLNNAGQLNYNYGDALRGEVIVDGNGNCFINSSTESNDLPVTSGVVQSSLAGNQDACIFKMNPDLSNALFCTYFGGSLDEAGYSIKRSPNAGLYIAGGSNSSDLPITQGWNTSAHGGIDGYVAQLDDSAQTVLNGSYIGTSGYDQAYFIDLDTSYNVFLYGQSDGGYPVNNANYSNPSSGQFIQKLPPDLSSNSMSTVFGTGSGGIDISPSAFMISTCNNIYLSGWGGQVNSQFGGVTGSTTNGLPITSNAYQSTTDGSDFYLMVLGADASGLKYGSFFGGSASSEHVDGGTSRFDDDGIVYQAVCGGCGGNSDFPTTPGAWSNSNNSSNCNLAAFKFDLSQMTAGIQMNNPPVACVEDQMNFDFDGTGGVHYYWDFGDGDTAMGPDVTHAYSDSGVYEVTLIVTDTLTCFQKDTAKVNVEIFTPLQGFTNPVSGICYGDSVQLNAGGAYAYSWSPSSTLNNSTVSDPIATPDSTTQYQVLLNECPVDTTRVTDTSYTTVEVYYPAGSASGDTNICHWDTVRIHAHQTTDQLWSPDYNITTSPTDANPKITPDRDTIYYVDLTDSNGCTRRDSVIVTVDTTLPQPVAYPDTIICLGDEVQLNASGGTVYKWFPSEGLNQTQTPNPIASPTNDMNYFVQVSNACGTDTIGLDIDVEVLVAQAWPDTIICPEDSVEVSASGGEQFKWSPHQFANTPDSSTTWVNPDRNMPFAVTVTDSLGCEDKESVHILEHNKPPLDLGPDRKEEYGDWVTLEPLNNGVTYSWHPEEEVPCVDCESVKVRALDKQTYYLEITDENGCRAMDSLTIIVSGALYIPNAFTPNDDDMNDEFKALGKGIDEFQLQVFNRWGELLFETENIGEGWDGTHEGEPVKSDVYVWRVKYTEEYEPQKDIVKTGHVTLLR